MHTVDKWNPGLGWCVFYCPDPCSHSYRTLLCGCLSLQEHRKNNYVQIEGESLVLLYFVSMTFISVKNQTLPIKINRKRCFIISNVVATPTPSKVCIFVLYRRLLENGKTHEPLHLTFQTLPLRLHAY